jgi:hypothetical protein
MQKQTLEETLRDKFKTGYDPVNVKVKMKAMNEENLEVSIEGIAYSIVDNTVSAIEKKSVVPAEAETTPELPEDPAHPVNGGSVANPAEGAETNPVSFEERAQALLAAYGAVTLKPINEDTAEMYGDLQYAVIHENGSALATGTLEDLELIIEQNKLAQESAA